MAALDALGLGSGRAQADGKIVGEMVAADGNHADVTNNSAAIGDDFRRATADIKQTASEVALVLGQTGFGGSERLEHRIADENARFIRGGNEILRRGNRGSDHVNVGDEALADHPDGVANAVLGVDNEFVRKDMQNFAVLGERNVAGGIDRAAHVFPFDVARARAKGNAAAAVCAAHVVAGHADKGFFHRHIGHAFGFFHGAADRTYRRVEIDDEAFAQTFGFGCAERQKLYELALDFGDEDGGFCAANVQPDEVFVFLRQSATPRIKAILFLRPPCPRWSPDSRPLAAHTANRWIGHARCGPATGQNCPRASCTCRKNRRSRSER